MYDSFVAMMVHPKPLTFLFASAQNTDVVLDKAQDMYRMYETDNELFLNMYQKNTRSLVELIEMIADISDCNM